MHHYSAVAVPLALSACLSAVAEAPSIKVARMLPSTGTKHTDSPHLCQSVPRQTAERMVAARLHLSPDQVGPRATAESPHLPGTPSAIQTAEVELAQQNSSPRYCGKTHLAEGELRSASALWEREATSRTHVFRTCPVRPTIGEFRPQTEVLQSPSCAHPTTLLVAVGRTPSNLPAYTASARQHQKQVRLAASTVEVDSSRMRATVAKGAWEGARAHHVKPSVVAAKVVLG